MKRCALLLIGLWQLPAAAESLPAQFAAQGQLLLVPLVSAPFPHASRAEGHTYKGEFFPAAKHYSDSTVALFIPKGFRETPQVDFVIHFHGWRNTVTGTLQNYQLVEQLVASDRNAILIVPEGPSNAPDSSGGKLEDVDGFEHFMIEVLATLQKNQVLRPEAAIGKVILSGHSGGYQVISSIVAQGGMKSQVREVWLFDALYAQSDRFLTWNTETQGKLINIYTDTGGTKTRTEEMIATLKQQDKPALLATDTTVTGAALQTNRFIFLHTDMTHNDVVAKRKTFQKFLETSCLSLRLEKPGETSRLQLQPTILKPSP
ncbi:MAG: hypothetical protein QM813_20545 [Verrucomicrobiota bacterium]